MRFFDVTRNFRGVGVGAGAGAGLDEAWWNNLVKILSASTAFAASVGWNASQNTYSVLLLHSFEFGKHNPPTLVSTLQHDVFDILKPINTKKKQKKLYPKLVIGHWKEERSIMIYVGIYVFFSIFNQKFLKKKIT